MCEARDCEEQTETDYCNQHGKMLRKLEEANEVQRTGDVLY